jgi:exonuclease SbcD
MKIIHTSDWHIGRTLYGRKRYDEFEAFLDQLVKIIREERATALLVSGDVFDTCTPSHRAQELYYRFLGRVARSACRHVVVIGGNHDSPYFLDAPRQLLRALDVHVIGAVCERPEDEVLVLLGEDRAPELIVCAVPYLRDRDVRIAEPGETPDDKERKLRDGILGHYRKVTEFAREKRRELGADLPIVAMGHLFTMGAKAGEDDGERNLYVGSLGHVPADIFPDYVSYAALGHLHKPQTVNGSETIRYSGAPIPMGFGELNHEKSVCVAEFTGAKVQRVTLREQPSFRKLARIEGDLTKIEKDVAELKGRGSVWLDVVHNGAEVVGDLRDRLEKAVSGTDIEILRVSDARASRGALSRGQGGESLTELSVDRVFDRCLEANRVPEEQWAELRLTHQEIVRSLEQDAEDAPRGGR